MPDATTRVFAAVWVVRVHAAVPLVADALYRLTMMLPGEVYEPANVVAAVRVNVSAPVQTNVIAEQFLRLMPWDAAMGTTLNSRPRPCMYDTVVPLCRRCALRGCHCPEPPRWGVVPGRRSVSARPGWVGRWTRRMRHPRLPPGHHAGGVHHVSGPRRGELHERGQGRAGVRRGDRRLDPRAAVDPLDDPVG